MAGGNAVASGSVILTANADGLKTGLDKSGKDVLTWGQKTGNLLATTLNKGGGGFSSAAIGGAVGASLAGLGSKLKAGAASLGVVIGTAVGGPIGAAIGGAVGATAGSLFESVFDAVATPFEKIDLFGKIVKQSKSLGISASQFQGLTAVMGKAGIEGDAVAQTFATMGKQISDVAAGKGKGAALAFEALGLDAERLMQLKPDEQFLAIADAFAAMPAGADQASAAVHLFGGQAAALLPELQKGAAGIQGFIDQGKKVGAVLSDDQLQAAANASKAWKSAKNEISLTWDGLVNRVTLIAAPVIEFFAKVMSKAFSFIQPVFEFGGRLAERLSSGFQSAFDSITAIASRIFDRIQPRVQPVFDWLGDAWMAVEKVAGIAWEGIMSFVVPAIETVVGWIEQGIDMLAEWTTGVFGFSSAWPKAETVVVAAFRAIGVAGAYTFDAIKAAIGGVAVGIGRLIKAIGDLTTFFKRALRDLTDSAATVAQALGLDETEAMFRKASAAVDNLGASIRAQGEEIEGWGQKQIDAFGQSAKQFNGWLDRMLQPKAAGEVVGKKIAEAIRKPILEEMAEIKLSSAITAGSKESFSLILKNQLRGTSTQDAPIKNLVKEAKKGNDLQKQNNKDLGKVRQEIEKIGVI